MKISRSTIVVAVLAVALLAANFWWFYHALDTGVTIAYRDQAIDEHRQALRELVAVAPVAASPQATRDSVLDAARAASGSSAEFEKDGYVWIGHLGYRFDSLGRLTAVRTSWSPF